MKKVSTKGVLKLFLYLLAGVVVGGFIGHFLSIYIDWSIFRESITIGTGETPMKLNLIAAEVVFGINLFVNFGSVIGVLIGVLFYTKI